MPEGEKRTLENEEKEERRKELKRVKENLWKRWRNSREKGYRRGKEDTDIDDENVLVEKLRKVEKVKKRLE